MKIDLNTLFKQSIAYPKRFIKGRLQKPTQSKDSLKPGEGAILKIDGKKIAAYKNKNGELATLSPVCTHMGCMVEWNNYDKTWDCPCHGSRYEADGTVKKGPAKKNLKKIDM